jgi:hypothetical protein
VSVYAIANTSARGVPLPGSASGSQNRFSRNRNRPRWWTVKKAKREVAADFVHSEHLPSPIQLLS